MYTTSKHEHLKDTRKFQISMDYMFEGKCPICVYFKIKDIYVCRKLRHGKVGRPHYASHVANLNLLF
jgi:hypothetical protein